VHRTLLRAQGGGEVLGDVVSGGDEAAEDDGVVAVGEQLLNLGRDSGELPVLLWADECGGAAGETE